MFCPDTVRFVVVNIATALQFSSWLCKLFLLSLVFTSVLFLSAKCISSFWLQVQYHLSSISNRRYAASVITFHWAAILLVFDCDAICLRWLYVDSPGASMPRSRKCGCIHPLPHMPSWCSVWLVKHTDNFTFFTLGYQTMEFFLRHAICIFGFSSMNFPVLFARVSSPALYPGSPRLRSWSTGLQSCQRFLWFFSVSVDRCQDSNSN